VFLQYEIFGTKNTMAQYQYQEQEDLMTDFDLPARKEVLKSSTKIAERIQARTGCQKDVLKPKFLPNFLKQTHAQKAAKKLSHISESTCKSNDIKQSTKVAGAADNKNVNSCDIWSDDVFDDFSSESIALLYEDAQKLFTSVAGKFSQVRWNDVSNSCFTAWACTMKMVQQVVKYEEELKFVSAAALIFYGGSWTYLAGVFAAADVFGTQQLLEVAWKVGTVLCTDDLKEDEFSPAQLKQVLRDLGLHIALFTAITVSPSWAEICITVAFASKIASYIPVEDALKSTISIPNNEMTEFDDYFSAVDDSWFDLLALIMSNILSLTLYGCFPRLIMAMYMGFIGCSLALECFLVRTRESDYEIFDRIFRLTEMGPFYIWGIISVFSMWQALWEYQGHCLFLSWVMFLHPVVRVYNVVDAESDEANYIKIE